MNKKLFSSVADLLPHTGDMILIDHVDNWSEQGVEVSVNHNKQHWYNDNEGNTPAWVGIEYMAQAIGALAGIKCLLAEEPIRIGFLLGTRKYKVFVPFFHKGHLVKIYIKYIYLGENNLAVFDCSIKDEHQNLLAQAQIKAIQPNKIDDIF